MPNPKDEIEKLSTAMKEAKSKRAYERYQAIYLHLRGYANEEIETIIGHPKKQSTTTFVPTLSEVLTD